MRWRGFVDVDVDVVGVVDKRECGTSQETLFSQTNYHFILLSCVLSRILSFHSTPPLENCPIKHTAQLTSNYRITKRKSTSVVFIQQVWPIVPKTAFYDIAMRQLDPSRLLSFCSAFPIRSWW